MIAPDDRSRSGGWPWGVLGMLLLVALAESFVAGQPGRFVTNIAMDWQTRGRTVYRKAPRCEVLCFGDSMLKMGLSPRILERELGRRSYSFALLDGKPAASYFLFRRAIEAGARPAAVIVDFQPECMAQIPSHLLENPHWAWLLNPREFADLAWTHGDPNFFARSVCQWLFPSVRCRERIRLNVWMALGGATPPFAEHNAKMMRNWTVNRGGLLLAKHPAFTGEVDADVARNSFLERWWGRPEISRYVHRFLALAEEHKIRVYWIVAPNVPKLLATQQSIGLSDRYSRYLSNSLKKYPHLRVIDTRRAGFNADVFVDPIHLDRDGNVALSHAVASVVRTGLESPASGPRWVDSLKYRPWTSDIPLEDVEQSLAAIRLEKQAARR